MLLGRLLTFAGFLRLPKDTGSAWTSGMGMDLSQVKSLLLELCNEPTLDAYRAFRIARSFGSEAEYIASKDDPKTQKRLNKEIVALYGLAASFLKPPSTDGRVHGGFVFREHQRLIPLVSDKLPKEYIDDGNGDTTVFKNQRHAWLFWCRKAHNKLWDWVQKHRCKTQKTRRQSDALGPILDDLPDPRIVIAELLNVVEDQLKNFNPRHQPRLWASAVRKLVFFEIVSVVPIRLKNFGLMTGSHFYKLQSEGIYRLFIPKDEFKNGEAQSTTNLSVDFPAELTPLFDMYFDLAWPVLNAPKPEFGRWNVRAGYTPDGKPIPFEADPRFVSLKRFERDNRVFQLRHRVKPATGDVLTDRIKFSLQQHCFKTTARWIAARYDARGWNPHAFRHIIATGIMKNGGTYEDVARMLWDSVDVVKREYVHLKNCEHLRGVVEENRKAIADKRKALRAGVGTARGNNQVPGTV